MEKQITGSIKVDFDQIVDFTEEKIAAIEEYRKDNFTITPFMCNTEGYLIYNPIYYMIVEKLDMDSIFDSGNIDYLDIEDIEDIEA